MYRRILATLFITGMAVCLARSAWAQFDPDLLGSNPPVRQDLGMLDTSFNFVPETNCRICHESGVPDRHHMLYGQPISDPTIVPYPDGDTYSCLSCHGQNFTVERDCVTCHNTASPHHTGEDAVNRHCTECHGDFVADYDDGHYIPGYTPSLVTP